MKASARNRRLDGVALWVSLLVAAACGDESGEASAGVDCAELEVVAPAQRAAPATLSNGDELPLVAGSGGATSRAESAGESRAAPSARAGGAFECEDTCASRRAECGSVCEESCGECASNESCENNRCVCQSGCDGSRCMDDCGRPCACPTGSACNAGGFCVALDACSDGSCPSELNPSAPPPLPVPPIPEGPGFR